MKIKKIIKLQKLCKTLCVTRYKFLVQTLIDYNPFLISGRNESVIKQLEATQNNSLRVASRWPFKRNNKDMQKELNIETVTARHLKLSKKYIQKASTSNSVIRWEVEEYQKAIGFIDGHYNHTRRNKK